MTTDEMTEILYVYINLWHYETPILFMVECDFIYKTYYFKYICI